VQTLPLPALAALTEVCCSAVRHPVRVVILMQEFEILCVNAFSKKTKKYLLSNVEDKQIMSMKFCLLLILRGMSEEQRST
jgi:hypothetical protein